MVDAMLDNSQFVEEMKTVYEFLGCPQKNGWWLVSLKITLNAEYYDCIMLPLSKYFEVKEKNDSYLMLVSHSFHVL